MLLLIAALLNMADAGPSAGPPAATHVCSAFMLSADGVWGGDDAFVTESGEFWLRRLTQDSEAKRMREQRYRLELASAERRELDDLVARSKFTRLRSSRRRPIPDEPTVMIGVIPCGHSVTSIKQYVADAQPGFRSVMSWFRERIRAAEGVAPVYDGASVPRWQPDGMLVERQDQ